MRNFKNPERDVILLFANIDLNTVAPVGSVVYTIDRLVDELDTKDIEKEYDLDSKLGKEPFHPKTLIKVALYAMHNCRFSLRKMEYDTVYNLAYRWLTGDKGIDHSTMGKFLVKYRNRIIELFAQVVEIGIEKGLIDFDVLAIDTVKLRANASYKQFKTQKGIEKEREKIKHSITELLEKMDKDNGIEVELLKKREDRLNEAANVLKERIALKSKELTKTKKEELEKKEKINMTDFDCMMVQQANKETNPGYCITTSTDTKNDFITYFQVNETNNDAKALLEVMEGSENNTGLAHDTVVADSGFSSIANLERLEEEKQNALIPDKRLEAEKREETSKGEYDRSKFPYNEEKDEYTCPEKQKLAHSGSYKNNGRIYNRYTNPDVCRNCQNKDKCTRGEYRTIVRDCNEIVKERMRVKLSEKSNLHKYKKRAHSAESPFGQIKHNLKFRIFMRRGFEKITMESSLLFMLHNILKIGRVMYA